LEKWISTNGKYLGGDEQQTKRWEYWSWSESRCEFSVGHLMCLFAWAETPSEAATGFCRLFFESGNISHPFRSQPEKTTTHQNQDDIVDTFGFKQ
jgi:hypothetical protein